MENIPINSKEGLHLYVNRDTDPLFLFFDYDVRSKSENMEFQHFHTYYEMMILVDESAGHIIEGQYYNLLRGDIVLLKPGILHKTVYIGKEPTKRFIISFSLKAIESVLRSVRQTLSIFNLDVPIIRLPVDDSEGMLSILFEMYEHCKRSTSYQDLEEIALLMRFLCRLTELAPRNQYTNQTFDHISHKIFSISSFIHKNYMEDLTLDSIAERFFISSCYLSRKFKEVLGFTLVQYIQMTRIRNAQKMLIESNESIQLIAERCGFSSFSQFNRVFDKYCSMPASVSGRKAGKERPIFSVLIFKLFLI